LLIVRLALRKPLGPDSPPGPARLSQNWE